MYVHSYPVLLFVKKFDIEPLSKKGSRFLYAISFVAPCPSAMMPRNMLLNSVLETVKRPLQLKVKNLVFDL